MNVNSLRSPASFSALSMRGPQEAQSLKGNGTLLAESVSEFVKAPVQAFNTLVEAFGGSQAKAMLKLMPNA